MSGITFSVRGESQTRFPKWREILIDIPFEIWQFGASANEALIRKKKFEFNWHHNLIFFLNQIFLRNTPCGTYYDDSNDPNALH